MNVKQQIERNIATRLSRHSAARSLATSCLDSTCTFVTSLLSYISETHDLLTVSGFSVDSSWQLVTQLVDHVFTDDMDKVRSFVREATDTHDAKSTSLAILWGTVATHGVMQDYTKYGIAHHPSISSEYVKFLVIQHGESDTGALDKVVELETKLDSVEKIAKAAKSSAATANNSIDQMKKNKK